MSLFRHNYINLDRYEIPITDTQKSISRILRSLVFSLRLGPFIRCSMVCEIVLDEEALLIKSITQSDRERPVNREDSNLIYRLDTDKYYKQKILCGQILLLITISFYLSNDFIAITCFIHIFLHIMLKSHVLNPIVINLSCLLLSLAFDVVNRFIAFLCCMFSVVFAGWRHTSSVSCGKLSQ